jgi:hypothetical protein
MKALPARAGIGENNIEIMTNILIFLGFVLRPSRLQGGRAGSRRFEERCKGWRTTCPHHAISFIFVISPSALMGNFTEARSLPLVEMTQWGACGFNRLFL